MIKILRVALSTLLFSMLILAAAAPARAQFAEQRVWGGTSGGSANAQTLTIDNMPAYVVGVPIRFLPGAANTTSATVNINSIGNVSIFKTSPAGPVVLAGGELQQTQPAEIVWNGTVFVLTSNNNATAASIYVTPQGYLTPCQVSSGSPVSGCAVGNPVQTGDVISATAFYYEPMTGNQIPIWNGSQFVVISFPELTLTLGSSNLAGIVYDVCVFSNSGTPTVVTSVAWSNSGAGTGARGTGAASAQISKTNGIWTNTVVITGKNGGSSYSIPAGQCTMVGSLYIDGTNGQVTAHRTVGASRKFGYFNFFNRQTISLMMTDATVPSWSYFPTTIRQSNANAADTLAVFTGLAEEEVSVGFTQFIQDNASSSIGSILIGLNSTTAKATGSKIGANLNASSGIAGSDAVAQFTLVPSLGVNNINSLESGSGESVFFGSPQMILSAQWRG